MELTTPQRNVTLAQMQQTDRLPGRDNRKDKTKSNREMRKTTQMGMSRGSPNSKLATPRLHSGAACDRPESNEKQKLPPVQEIVWQQSTETITKQGNLNKTNNHSILHYPQEKTTVASQPRHPRELNHRTT